MRRDTKIVLGIGAAVGVFLLATRRAQAATTPTRRTEPIMRTPTTSNAAVARELPSKYGRDYRTRNRTRWAGEWGQIVRGVTPRIWPGLPPEQIMGFTAGGGQRDNTTTVSPISFHEIGYFSVPAGPRGGPAPNPNPGASDNEWGQLAGTDIVRSVLGRSAVMGPDAWKNYPLDQAAVGVAMLRYRANGSTLVDELKPTSLSSQWAWVVASMSHSAGAGGMGRHLNRYAAELADVNENLRFGRLLEAIEREWRRGVPFSPAHSHRNRAWTVVRTWQKMASAKQLAADAGASTSWWTMGLRDPAATEVAVTSAALAVPA